MLSLFMNINKKDEPFHVLEPHITFVLMLKNQELQSEKSISSKVQSKINSHCFLIGYA